MSRIHPGQTCSQVRQILGSPCSRVCNGYNQEQWFYSQRVCRGYNGRPYQTKVIEFKRGRVVGFYNKRQKRHCHVTYVRRPCYPSYPVYAAYPSPCHFYQPMPMYYQPRPVMHVGIGMGFNL